MYLKSILSAALLAASAAAFLACGGGNGDEPDGGNTEKKVYKPTQVILGWTHVPNADLPSYIYIFKSPATLQNRNAVAYLAVLDLNEAPAGAFDIVGEKTGLSTPANYYKNNNKPAIIMNGGYFASSGSVSLMARDGNLLCPNIRAVTRSDGSSNASFYPTRGAFSLKSDGSYVAEWVYTAADGQTYSYPRPAANKAGTTPLQMPSATFPSGATAWSAKTAIGGGPVLIKGSAIQNTWEAELIDAGSGVGPTATNPRSAIGYTRNNHLIFFCCEGRNMTSGVPGYTLAEVAAIMRDLGCTEALNLDGGGSSCLLINGVETIKPSDGSQRSVSGCVVMK